MSKEKIKAYIYTRVSTAIQVDGYSLEAQKTKIKAFALYNEYEIAGEYEDAGKSGKSIEGRFVFNQMMEDIKSGKDSISYVLVFKLSRFARNVADVLSTLQVMQDFGVNLICVEDGIDSSKDAGKLMISVLSAVAEIERENIRVQTMEGRIQKAKEGKWNGGFAPYGYKLENGNLVINEEESEAVRIIFDRYVNTTMGANGISKYLERQGIKKIARHNGKNPYFDPSYIRRIIANPVYNGKIAYGRRRTEKVHSTRNDYHLVNQDEYILVDGKQDAIITDSLWEAAQNKLKSQAKKYEHSYKGNEEYTHLLSGILRCPICDGPLYGNRYRKKKKDGSRYKESLYYNCKHRRHVDGKPCNFTRQINEKVLDKAVVEIICQMVKKPKFVEFMRESISLKVDTKEIDKEIENSQETLRKAYKKKNAILSEIDNLDIEDRHYKRKKNDLSLRLDKLYDKIEEMETSLEDAKRRKQSLETNKVSSDNIYKILMNFEKLYSLTNNQEKHRIIESLINKIEIHKNKKENGQLLKAIYFNIPLIKEDLNYGLDNLNTVETIVLLQRK